MKFFFRLMFVGLGLWLSVTGARDTYRPLAYRLTGTVVEGEVIGFWAGRGSPSIQPGNTGVRNGNRLARRPAFKYPAEPAGKLEFTGKPPTTFTFSFNPFELGEKVTVVFPRGQPEKAQLFGVSSVAGALGILAAGALCVYIGLGGRL